MAGVDLSKLLEGADLSSVFRDPGIELTTTNPWALPVPEPKAPRHIAKPYEPGPITRQGEKDLAGFLATPYVIGQGAGNVSAPFVHYGMAGAQDAAIPAAELAVMLAGGVGAKSAKGTMGEALQALKKPKLDALGFYSAADHALPLYFRPTDTVTMQTLAGKGIKRAEIEMRAPELLAALEAKGGVKVGDLQAALDKNPIQLREGRYVAGDRDKFDEWSLMKYDNEYRDLNPRQQIGAENHFGRPPSPDPEYVDYSLAAGRDADRAKYEERVIHGPDIGKEALAEYAPFEKAIRDKYLLPKSVDLADAPLTPGEAAQLHKLAEASAVKNTFTGGHFNEPNVYGHYQRSIEKMEVPREQLEDIGRRMAEAVGAKSVNHLGSGAYETALQKGAVTPQEAALYAKVHSWNIGKMADPRDVMAISQAQSDWGQKIRDALHQSYAENTIYGPAQPGQKMAYGRATPEQRAEIAKRIQADGPRALDVVTADVAKAADLQGRFEQAAANHFEAVKRREAREAAGEPAADLRQAERQANSVKQLLAAELRSAQAAAPPHPFVNNTDAWARLVSRRILQDANAEGVAGISTPTGGTVLSYNPGKEHGMEGFYGAEAGRGGIFPGVLEKELRRLDPNYPGRSTVRLPETENLDAPPNLHHYFPLTDEVRRRIKEEGLPYFGAGGLTLSQMLQQPSPTER